MVELAARLRALRAELVERMVSDLAADGNWLAWTPLLVQIETALQAVEAVMSERKAEAGGGA